MNDQFVDELVKDVEDFIRSKKKLEKSFNFKSCLGTDNIDSKMDDYHEKMIILKSKYIKVDNSKIINNKNIISDYPEPSAPPVIN